MVELSTRLREALAVERPHLFGDEDLVFPNDVGGYLNSANFRRRIFNRLVRKALGRGRRFAPHGLRRDPHLRTTG